MVGFSDITYPKSIRMIFFFSSSNTREKSIKRKIKGIQKICYNSLDFWGITIYVSDYVECLGLRIHKKIKKQQLFSAAQ